MLGYVCEVKLGFLRQVLRLLVYSSLVWILPGYKGVTKLGTNYLTVIERLSSREMTCTR